MRSLLLLLLLLPSGLLAQVSILLPVVAKDSAGKAATDLKLPNFAVNDAKRFRLTEATLIPPATVSSSDSQPSVVLIYDAANIPTNSFELNVRDLRDFLADIAHRNLPVTLLVNTADGLRLIHNARTSPQVLTAALAATTPGKPAPTAVPSDPQVEAEAKNLRLLETAVRVPRSRLDAGVDQMKSLLAFAHLVQQLPGRKALVWVTLLSPVGATENPAYWSSTTSLNVDRALLPMYESMIEQLNAAHVSVYPLLYSQANPEGVGALWDIWAGLMQLAETTGGLPFRLGQQNSFAAAVDAALKDFGSYYMLTIETAAPKELDWIPIKIKVDRPGLKVRAAPGFVGLKPVKTN